MAQTFILCGTFVTSQSRFFIGIAVRSSSVVWAAFSESDISESANFFQEHNKRNKSENILNFTSCWESSIGGIYNKTSFSTK
jgi:hypothetical protein